MYAPILHWNFIMISPQLSQSIYLKYYSLKCANIFEDLKFNKNPKVYQMGVSYLYFSLPFFHLFTLIGHAWPTKKK
jgi:hypothetical protein